MTYFSTPTPITMTHTRWWEILILWLDWLWIMYGETFIRVIHASNRICTNYSQEFVCLCKIYDHSITGWPKLWWVFWSCVRIKTTIFYTVERLRWDTWGNILRYHILTCFSRFKESSWGQMRREQLRRNQRKREGSHEGSLVHTNACIQDITIKLLFGRGLKPVTRYKIYSCCASNCKRD